MADGARPARATLARVRELEALGRRGWPALEVDRVGGWLVGASGPGAYTRRANSVAAESSVLAPTPAPATLDERLRAVERWYADRGRPAVFKLADRTTPEDLAARLAERGYREASPTIVQTVAVDAALATPPRAADDAARIDVVANRIDPDWWAASLEGSAIAADAHDVHDDYRAILDGVVGTAEAALFGSAVEDGRVQAVALGVVARGCVSFVQVATRPSARGRGLAERVLRALLYAARERDAEQALLSVELGNTAARSLYARLGFVERYRYRYAARP